MASSMKTWEYTDDLGTVYNRKVRTDYTTQLDTGSLPKIGGQNATATHGVLPRGFKPRVALCKDSAGLKYRIICFSNTATLYATVGTTFTVFPKNGGSSVTVTQYSNEGERKRQKLLTP